MNVYIHRVKDAVMARPRIKTASLDTSNFEYGRTAKLRDVVHEPGRTIGTLIISTDFMPSVVNQGSTLIGQVLRGEGTVWIDDDCVCLKPGEEFTIPKGAYHYFDSGKLNLAAEAILKNGLVIEAVHTPPFVPGVLRPLYHRNDLASGLPV